MRIEILTRISGVEFDICKLRGVVMEVAQDLRVPVIALEDLIANKRAAGRAKDAADVEALENADGD